MVFTAVFAFEMVLKLIGLGVRDYVKDRFNIFDGVIVFFSLAEYIGNSTDGGKFTVLRGFRLLRVFKIVRSWTSLKQLLQTVIVSLPAITNLGMLTFLFLFIYALVGKQFFAGELYDSEGELSRYHFNTMGNALVTMFIVLTGENWNEIMRIVVNAKGIAAVPFFVSAIVIGNFMLLNLFLAILLKYIEERNDEEDEEENIDNKINELIKQANTDAKSQKSSQ